MVNVRGAASAEDGDRRQAARAEAALWVVRSHGRQEQCAESIDRWLATDAANDGAYAQTMTVWNELGQVLPDWKRDEVLPPRPARKWRELALVPVLACLALVSLLGWNWYNSPTMYRTGVGEQRIVTLADGTKVTLNTDTEVSVARPGRERRVALVRGEALFNVAHDASRPFIVEASGRYVRALGTSFIVRKDSSQLDVILLTGRVRIGRGASVGENGAVQLSPGDRYREADGGRPRLDRPSLDVVTAWRDGELVLDNTPLRDAVAEMNRYRTKPIVLRGAGLANLMLSGVFRTAESDRFANTVGSIYGLSVNERPNELAITERKVSEGR
jgi:transmembrane sensor